MNVLHAPKNVGSHPSTLARAENAVRALRGMPGRSWSVNFSPHPAVEPADEDYPLRARADRGLLGKLAYAVAPFAYGLRRVRRFDVLHLNFGESLFSFSRRFPGVEMLDLQVWKGLGKRVFMTFQGCDVRQKGLSARSPISACKSGFCDYTPCNADLDARRSSMVARVRGGCDKIFCLNPDLVAFVEGAEFLPYASVDPWDYVAVSHAARDDLPVVLHAPTNRSVKGTALLERASAELQRSVPHRLVMIENAPRERVLALYATADLVVDQLLVGWYGGMAVEAMACGVPVVAYLDETCLGVVPRAMREELPILRSSPEGLVETLRPLLRDRSALQEHGRKGQAYVRRWHDPRAIAGRMLELYDDPARPFWDGFQPSVATQSP